MKKNLLTIGVLLVAYTVQAQNAPLMHVDRAGVLYVGKGALVYNGGGLQTKDTGFIENHGNILVDGTASDVFRTLDNSNNPKPYSSTDVNIINKLNEPQNYATWNEAKPVAGYQPVYTYGQLMIRGISTHLTGFVSQEFRIPHHGDRQQIAIPFYQKQLSTLNQIGQTFNTDRYGGRAIMKWNNSMVEFDHFNDLNKLVSDAYETLPPVYYMIGNKGMRDFGDAVRMMTGKPVFEGVNTVTLHNAGIHPNTGATINFGAGGNNTNSYLGRYNTYLQDSFAAARGNVWTGDYGRNIYQIGNPFLTNLDLSNIGTLLPNINGIRFEPANVIVGQGSASIKFVTFSSGVAVGDYNYMVVRPMSTFVIKMLNNNPASLNLDNLRSFEYKFVANPAGANKAAGKSNSTGTVKQLAVLGLDSSGTEIERTYYAVSNGMVTGMSPNSTAQVATTSINNLGTWEEDPATGGVDDHAGSLYWLYINEANETDYKGKGITLSKYTSDIVNFKFEISENGNRIEDNQHTLTSGDGFYFKGIDGVVRPISHNEIIPATGNVEQDYTLYYGKPSEDGTLGTGDTKAPARTFVAYNPSVEGYIVRFDPKWKKADLQVYDMSGKLVSSEKSISAASDYQIKMDSATKGIYVVVITSDTGDVVQTKITKK